MGSPGRFPSATVGLKVGALLGRLVCGAPVGLLVFWIGALDGEPVLGASDGEDVVGVLVVGACVGLLVGASDVTDGDFVGSVPIGDCVGLLVGAVGDCVGE